MPVDNTYVTRWHPPALVLGMFEIGTRVEVEL